MKPIRIYRAAHLFPFLEILEEIGAPVESCLRQAKLPTLLLERPNAALPMMPTLDFLTNTTRKEGIDELGLRAVRHIRLADFDRTVVLGVLGAPTLQMGIKRFCELAPVLEDTSITFQVAAGDKVSKVCSTVEKAGDLRGLRYSEWGQNMALLAVARAFAGPSWAPAEMAFASHGPLSRYAHEQLPNTRFLVGQKAAWVTIPRELLSLSAPARTTATGMRRTADAAPAPAAELACDMPATLRRVLATYLSDGAPSVEFAAELSGIGVRTFQRRLGEHGLTYSEILQQARFEVASNLLHKTDAKLLDIAYEAGYDDPSHFSRAFRRTAGCSPREYRRQRPRDAGQHHLAA